MTSQVELSDAGTWMGRPYEWWPGNLMDDNWHYWNQEHAAATAEEPEYEPTVRQKTREPRAGVFWCYGCDRTLVREGQKCRVCGQLAKRRRNKK